MSTKILHQTKPQSSRQTSKVFTKNKTFLDEYINKFSIYNSQSTQKLTAKQKRLRRSQFPDRPKLPCRFMMGRHELKNRPLWVQAALCGIQLVK
jgi:hypothetical protein